MGYTISYICVSHRGLCRQTHQDNFLCGGQILPPGTNGTPDALTGTLPSGPDALFGVFDGMGGEEMGEMGAYLAARETEFTNLRILLLGRSMGLEGSVIRSSLRENCV